MCGRIDLHTPAEEIALRFHAIVGVDCNAVQPRWNVAPANKILAVVGSQGGRQLMGLSWGFVAHWARDLTGPKPINARADTVFAKPMFRDAARQRRCLIPVDGFFEWVRDGPRRIPYYFCMEDVQPFALAGLWDVWSGRTESDEGYTLHTCAILTTAANDLMAPIHERMPVIVAAANYDAWLAGEARGVERLLRPFDSARMVAYPVSPRVDNAANDGPALIEPFSDSCARE